MKQTQKICRVSFTRCIKKYVQFLLFVFIQLCIGTNTFAQISAEQVQDENLSMVTEFTADSHDTLYPDQTYTPVTTYKGVTYLVWVDKNRYPMIAKIENGNAQQERLVDDNSYQAKDNGHHKFSIGIDNDGYIHIAGDMHGYPYDNEGHLPDEFRNKKCLYWVSDNPEDISSFSFRGDSDQAPKGSGHTYIYFTNDRNGELYYAARNFYNNPSTDKAVGPQGVNVERYDTNTKSWTQLGAEYKNSGKKMLVWEDNGTASGYQGVRSDIRFDNDNRMHFTCITRRNGSNNPVDNGAKSGSGVLYAYSDDGGDTWKKADGTSISSYPMWMNSGPNQADIIVDNYEFVSMPSSVAFNQNDEPFVWFVETKNGNDVAKYRQWSNSSESWSPVENLPLNANGWDRQWNDGRGIITLSAYNSGQIYRTSSLGETGKTHNIAFSHVDRRYLHDSGELRGLSRTGSGDDTKIHVVSLVTDLPGGNVPTTGNPISAYSKIEAEDFNSQSGIELSNNGNAVGYIDSGDWIKFDDVAFGSGAVSVAMNLSKGNNGTGTIAIRKGSVNGDLLGQLSINNTGGWTDFETVTADISDSSGTHDIFLVFTGSLDVDWLQFSKSPISAYSKIQAEDFDSQSGIELSNNGNAVGYIDTGDWIKFDEVAFGSGAVSVTMNLSKGSNGTGTIAIRKGSVNGDLLGQLSINNTGGWTDFETVTTDISNSSGTHDIFLVFTGSLDVDWLQFSEDDSGLVGTNVLSAYSKIEAEDFDSQSGIELSNNGNAVGYIDTGDWIKFDDIAFGSGAVSVTMNLSKGNNGTGTIAIRKGSVNGDLLGQLSINNTGGWTDFETVTTDISDSSGTHDIYLVFTGALDVDWLQFSEEGDITTNPTETIEKLSGSWGVTFGLYGGDLLDHAVENRNVDYLTGAQELVENLPEAGHIMTTLTWFAHPDEFNLLHNTNVDIANEIHPYLVPEPEQDAMTVDVYNTFKNAGKTVIAYIAVNFFSSADPDVKEAWEDYYNTKFDGDEYEAYKDLQLGFIERTKDLVDGYWLDGASHIDEIGKLDDFISAIRSVHPGCVISSNDAKNYFENDEGEDIYVDSDGVDDEDPQDYRVISHNALNDRSDYTNGHVTPLAQGAPPNSWAYEELTISDIQNNPWSVYGSKSVLKHGWFPVRERWHIHNRELLATTEQAYRMVKNVVDAGGMITLATTVDQFNTSADIGKMMRDELEIMKEISDRLSNNVDFEPYARPLGAYYKGEDITDTQSTIEIQENQEGFCGVNGSIGTSNLGYTHDGFANPENAKGAGIEWQIEGNAGVYELEWRFASISNRPGRLLVNGEEVVSEIDFNTGSWKTWGTNSVTVTFNESGFKNIRLEANSDDGLGNIDYLSITGPDIKSVDCVISENKAVTDIDIIQLYPNPVANSFSLSQEFKTLEIFSFSGQKLLEFTENKDSIDVSTLSDGMYFARIDSKKMIKFNKL